MQVRGLRWRPYGVAEPVLRDVTLDLAPGERVLLAGPSGSGKSSLLRALAGLLLTADAGELDGEVVVDGADPQARPGAVGLVLQDPGSGVVASTVGRDVAFGLENVGLPPAAMAAPVAEALRDVRLDLDASTPPSTLSGGEQQRLALAGALALAPGLLLLDEPLAMLDERTAAAVRDVVVDVAARRGLTLVVVEHRLGPWLDHVDRLVVLGPGGTPLADGAPGPVIAERLDDLLAAGVWVPGHADPEPTDLDVRWGPAAVGDGEAVAVARAVTVRRTSRTLSGPARETLAVDRADVEVPAGRLSALVGPSGAGKSTLLAAMGGLLAPDRGEVRWAPALGTGATAPHRLPGPALARHVAWVPQRAASTVVARTVREEVLATPRALGTDDAATRARAEALLDGLGLAARADLDPRRLSGGEQRRLALAAAAVHQPALVLADEPTVGQDRHTWAAVAGVLTSLRDAGSGVLVTTHDAGLVARADHVHRVERPVERPAPTRPDAVRRPLAAGGGPLALLLASALVLPLPAVLTSWRQGALVLLSEVLLAGLALAAPGPGDAVPGQATRLLRRLVAPVLGVLGVVWSTWLLGGHDPGTAAGAGLRVLSMVLPSVVLLPYVDPDALGDHLAQRLRLPARPVVAISVALQRFQALGDLWAELRTARRVRGVGGGRSLVGRGRDVLATTLGLLVGALDDAAVLAVAMDARGFAAAGQRTWAGAAPWRRADTVVVLVGLVPLLVAVAGRLLLPG